MDKRTKQRALSLKYLAEQEQWASVVDVLNEHIARYDTVKNLKTEKEALRRSERVIALQQFKDELLGYISEV